MTAPYLTGAWYPPSMQGTGKDRTSTTGARAAATAM